MGSMRDTPVFGKPLSVFSVKGPFTTFRFTIRVEQDVPDFSLVDVEVGLMKSLSPFEEVIDILC